MIKNDSIYKTPTLKIIPIALNANVLDTSLQIGLNDYSSDDSDAEGFFEEN